MNMENTMTIPQRFGFYSILTAPLRGYEYCTRVLVDAGVAFVQLRMKESPQDMILPIAEKMREITSGSTTKLIINDYPEIAVRCEADGVHIGQSDGNYTTVRNTVGTEAVIGISTHSVSQTEKSCSEGPDYIGIGPVFPTPTKKFPDPVIGIDGMSTMLKKATVPAVVIGGIDLTNLHTVLEAGAENFCMVRQFTQSGDPESTVKKIQKIYRSFHP